MSAVWNEAKRRLAGGVNSPVRAFRAVGGEPVFMEKARGPFIWDYRGKRYTDFCLSWGAVLWGHAFAPVTRAIRSQAGHGTSFGTATELETALAAEIQKAFPGMQKLRFTSSGTEAVMSAVRLARGVTGRKKILKFEGCYHGHADGMLVKAGSGLATFGSPDSAGVPKETASMTAVLPYNDEKALDAFFRKNKDLACAVVEPVAANMGLIPGGRNFLAALREKTKRTGALLIFDEVISGFRIAYGGAQHLYGIEPDLTVLGKIIGGGLPIGAFGGRPALMKALSPEGRVYQAGTLSGNPISMAAGRAVLSHLRPAHYDKLNRTSQAFQLELELRLRRKGRVSLRGCGSMFTVFFMEKPPKNFKQALKCDRAAFRRFFHAFLSRGVYLPPSPFETAFLSTAHDGIALEAVLRAAERI